MQLLATKVALSAADVLSLDCMRQASKEAQKHLCEKWDYCVCELVPEQK